MRFLRNAADAMAASWLSQPLQYLLYPFAKLYNALNRRESLIQPYTSNALQCLQAELCEELCVRGGPFKGMKYSSAVSTGSTLYPKLLGTYEREISPFVEDLLSKQFELIIDIGCAEGYYAVGFSRLFKGSLEKTIAFDTDEKAQALCAENATINDVRVDIRGFCDMDTLIDICSSKNALIFIDAEGYEKSLISTVTVNALSHCTFLIESHDFIDIDMTRNLLNFFSKTHSTQVISSIDDIDKAYNYADLDKYALSLSDKLNLFAECRPAIMKWIYATPFVQL